MRRIRWLIGFVFMLVLLGLMILIGYDLGWRRVRIEIRQGLEGPPTALVFTPTPSGGDIAEATVSAIWAQQTASAFATNAPILTQAAKPTETPQGVLVTTVLETAFPITGTPVSLEPTFTPTPTPTQTEMPGSTGAEYDFAVVDDNSGGSDFRSETANAIKEAFPDSEIFTYKGCDHELVTMNFSVIVMDYTMTNSLDGGGCTRLVLAVHPNTKVIGYSMDGTWEVPKFMEAGAAAFVKKPDLWKLTSEIRRLLGESAP